MSAVPNMMEVQRTSAHEDSMEFFGRTTQQDFRHDQFAAQENLPLQHDSSIQNSLSQQFLPAQTYQPQTSMLPQQTIPAAFYSHGYTNGHGSYITPAVPYQANLSTIYGLQQPNTSSLGPSWHGYMPSMQPVHTYPATQRYQRVQQYGPISAVSGTFQHSPLPAVAYPPIAPHGPPASTHAGVAAPEAHVDPSQYSRAPTSPLELVTAESAARQRQTDGQVSPSHTVQVQRSYRPQNQPGPCKASEVKSFTDGSGVPWIEYDYHVKHVAETVKIRVDIERVNVADIPEDFKLNNLCYQGAYTGVPKTKPKPKVKKAESNTRPCKPPARKEHEQHCNVRGWKLAFLNQAQLAGQPGKLQRAENSYCNSLPGMQSRRVKKEERQRAAALKKADAPHLVPVDLQRPLPLDLRTAGAQSQVMPAPPPSLAPSQLAASTGVPNESSLSLMSMIMPPTPHPGPSNLRVSILQARSGIEKRPVGPQQSSRLAPTSTPQPAETNTGTWSGSTADFGCGSIDAAGYTPWVGDMQWQDMASSGSGVAPSSYSWQSSTPCASDPVFGHGTLQEPQGMFDFSMPIADPDVEHENADSWDLDQDGSRHGFVIDPESGAEIDRSLQGYFSDEVTGRSNSSGSGF